MVSTAYMEENYYNNIHYYKNNEDYIITWWRYWKSNPVFNENKEEENASSKDSK